MRALAILVGLVGLTACDSNRHVDFSRAGRAEPAAEARPTATPVATPTATATTARIEDGRLRSILLSYRADVETVLTTIWSKPAPTSDEVAVFVPTLDRILKINRKLQKQSALSNADLTMLIEGERVMQGVRATLTGPR